MIKRFRDEFEKRGCEEGRNSGGACVEIDTGLEREDIKGKGPARAGPSFSSIAFL